MGLISLLVGGAMDAHKAIKQNNAKNDNSSQTVVVQNRYSLDVPSFLSPTNKLNADASLQYYDKTLDCAVQVIDEPKSEFSEVIEGLRKEVPDFGKDKPLLENYATITLGNMFDLNKVEIGSWIDTSVNGCNAITLEVWQKRTFTKDAAHYRYGFIEGKEMMYQILIIVGGSSISKIGDRLENIVKSFKEL
jgi:hypothetical protein